VLLDYPEALFMKYALVNSRHCVLLLLPLLLLLLVRCARTLRSRAEWS
jgi:hypothetical protein